MYTDAQSKKLNSIAQKRLDKSLVIGGFPKLSDFKCKKYLNIENATMHKPFVVVTDASDDSIYVEATFAGSGIMSHPKKMAWIPKDAFTTSDYFPHLIALFYIVTNKLKFWKPNKKLAQSLTTGEG